MFHDIFNSIHITIRDVIVNACAKSNGYLVIIKIELKQVTVSQSFITAPIYLWASGW